MKSKNNLWNQYNSLVMLAQFNRHWTGVGKRSDNANTVSQFVFRLNQVS